jgi:hypothetical protein
MIGMISAFLHLPCAAFIYVENLRFTDEDTGTGGGDAGGKQERHKPATATQLKNDAAVGNILTNQRPDFDSRNYGYGKLSDLINATTLFEIERRSPGDGKQALMYAREKRRAPATRKAAATRSSGTRSTSTRSTGTRSTGTRTAKAAS